MTNELTRYLAALTLASSVGIVAVLLLRRAVRLVFGPIASYAAWLLVPVAIAAVLLPEVHGIRSVGIRLELDSALALSRALAASARVSPSAAPTPYPAWVLGAWGAGSVIFLLYLAGLQRAFVRSLGTLSGSRRVLWAESSVGCPALLGVFKPKLVLPADFGSRYTRRERLLILAHERVHLRRGDGIWNAIDALLRCIFWFNPLAHLASIRFRVDQELACDAAVLQEYSGVRRSYASALLKTQFADAALPVGCHWQSAHLLKERLQMVKKSLPGRKRCISGYVLVALLSTALGYSVWAAQPAVGTLQARVLSWPTDLQKFYPEEAKTRGIEGMVRIAVTLDSMGRATDTRIISVTPQDLGFGAAASTMVHFMTFSNPTGHRVTVKLPVKFALHRGEHGHRR